MIRGLILFGDSILAGTGASTRESGCSKLIKAKLKIQVSLKGINRNTSQDGLNRIETDVLAQPSLSHVVILFGNNDCRLIDAKSSVISQEVFVRNLEEISGRIKKNGQIPLFCNLQPIDASKLFKFLPEFQRCGVDPEVLQSQYSNLIEDFCKKNQESVIDIRNVLSKDLLAMDGLHPNDEGHGIIANRILQTLKWMEPALQT